jgi:hypothetical protein
MFLEGKAWNSLFELAVIILPFGTENLYEPKERLLMTQKRGTDLGRAAGTWWTISFPSSNQKAVGTTTMNLQKFDGGWKIVASHSSTNEM